MYDLIAEVDGEDVIVALPGLELIADDDVEMSVVAAAPAGPAADPAPALSATVVDVLELVAATKPKPPRRGERSPYWKVFDCLGDFACRTKWSASIPFFSTKARATHFLL
jgi:hypothetical protein